MDQPAAREKMPVADQVVDALRVYAADNADVTHRLARWLGVNAGDAEAFGQVLYAQDRGTPLSPSTLARHLGIGTGATATVLNRLEAAGLVTRSREHRDRRVVTLRVVPEVKEQAIRFFEPLAERVGAMMQNHPEELLRTLVALLDELHIAVTGVVDGFDAAPRLRHAPEPAPRVRPTPEPAPRVRPVPESAPRVRPVPESAARVRPVPESAAKR